MDVSKETQHAVGLLIESATNDPAECFVPPRPLITDQQASNGNGASVGNNKMLHVESNKFFVVKATAESLELLSEYLRVVVNLEVVVTDAMGRIIEFLKVSHTHLFFPLGPLPSSFHFVIDLRQMDMLRRENVMETRADTAFASSPSIRELVRSFLEQER